MFSAVLPSYNKKILCAKHAANHTITQMDIRCKGTLLIYVSIVFYFVNNTLSWQHLHRRFKCSGMSYSWLTDSQCFKGSQYPHLQSQATIKYVHMCTSDTHCTAVFRLLEPDCEDTMILQNVWNQSPNIKVPCHRRLESLATLMMTSNLAVFICFISLQKYTTVFV